jgi:hypothetical protein
MCSAVLRCARAPDWHDNKRRCLIPRTSAALVGGMLPAARALRHAVSLARILSVRTRGYCPNVSTRPGKPARGCAVAARLSPACIIGARSRCLALPVLMCAPLIVCLLPTLHVEAYHTLGAACKSTPYASGGVPMLPSTSPNPTGSLQVCVRFMPVGHARTCRRCNARKGLIPPSSHALQSFRWLCAESRLVRCPIRGTAEAID